MKMDKNILVGKQVLDVLTSGMYNSPLMIYREYIQNAVDSIDQRSTFKDTNYQPHVDISIDGQTRTISIIDNGKGVPAQHARNVLMSLGRSEKENSTFRGFRGIGRLGGLAYCDRLIFETRAYGEDIVTRVVWDHLKLQELSKNQTPTSLEDAIQTIVMTEQRKASAEDFSSFFRVELENVRCFHSDQVMNVTSVRDHLSQVAPVPFSDEFSSKGNIEKHIFSVSGYRVYSININGQQLFRPYENIIEFAKEKADKIEDIQEFEILGSDNDIIAKGWLAKLKYYGSLPANNRMRGIRVRQGNIEIGGEYFLADCFAERRFATWQVGEIHVQLNALKANARRDGFEETPNFERFLEYTTRLGLHLSKACRAESKNRNNLAIAKGVVERIEASLAENSIYIDRDHFAAARSTHLRDLSSAKKYVDKHGLKAELNQSIESLEKHLENDSQEVNFLVDMINAQKLNNKSGKKALTDFIREILKNKGKNNEIDEILKSALTHYLKKNSVFSDNRGFVISSSGI